MTSLEMENARLREEVRALRGILAEIARTCDEELLLGDPEYCAQAAADGLGEFERAFPDMAGAASGLMALGVR